MAFVSSDGGAPAATSTATQPTRPILTTLCNVLGALELLSGLLGAAYTAQNFRNSIGAAVGVLATAIGIALIIFGVGQAIDYLSRTATAAERTAQATERLERRAAGAPNSLNSV